MHPFLAIMCTKENGEEYQEIVSTGVARWQYDIALSKEVAKSKDLIKRPEHSKRGYWVLSEKGKG